MISLTQARGLLCTKLTTVFIQRKKIQFRVVRERAWYRIPWHRSLGSQFTTHSERSWSSPTPFTKDNSHAIGTGQRVKGSELLGGSLVTKVWLSKISLFLVKIKLSNNQILPTLASEPSDDKISLLHC